MTLAIIIGVVAIGLLGTISLVVVGLRGGGGGDASDLQVRLEEFAGREAPVTLEEIELSQPFSQRVLLPILQRASNFAVRFTPAQTMEATRQKLEKAGRPNNWGPAEFYGFRALAAVVLLALIFLLLWAAQQPILNRIAFAAIAGVMGYILPGVWLGSRIRQRQKELIKTLPDALDLLTIAVEAGMGFDGAMAKVADKWDNELSNEFGRVIHEIRLGKARAEALREMDRRTGIQDIKSFIAAVIQAEQLGVSMAKVMRIQSEQMRIRRRQRAEEEAHKAPVKMLFPMVFLIFPALFIVLLGPAVLIILESGIVGNV
ncbi:MAG: type II secretion system F family protein [Anaerolineae bacterium]